MIAYLCLVLLLCSVADFAKSVTVTVDLGLDNHAISPLIYGMNFVTTSQLSAARVPITRWGGNTCTRYNYKVDTYNTAHDYYYENIPSCWGGTCPPADPLNDSAANQLLQQSIDNNMTTFLTVPTLGLIAKNATYDHPFPCGFPRTIVGDQQSYDPYDTNCGNGIYPNGSKITPPDPLKTSINITAQWNKDWATYLVSKFGPSNGKRIYMMDNEPNLWSETHRDVHPSPVSYDELWQKLRDNAVAVLSADPTAEIAGVCEWGWPNYFCSSLDLVNTYCSASSPDRASHSGTDLTSWLLQQAKAYETAHGQRILHYLDLHYYPQGGENPHITRSLWDKTYTDPSWINDKIYMIPRMVAWVTQNYPGTKISLGEYDFGDHTTAAGAVALTEALGIFGREGLHAATHWGAPDTSDLAFSAFVLYTNYDGQGHGFESTSCRATSETSSLYAFSAYGATGATIVLCNEAGSTASVTLQIANFTALGTVAKFWAPTGSGSAVSSTNVNFAGGSDPTITLEVDSMLCGILAIPGNTQGTTTSTSGEAATTTGDVTTTTQGGGGAVSTTGGDESSAIMNRVCIISVIVSICALLL